MPGQAVAGAEAVLKQLLHERLGIGQGEQAGADITGRRHAQRTAQPPRAAAVVGDGNHGGQVAAVFLQLPQHGGEAGPPSHGYQGWPSIQIALGVKQFDQGLAAAPRQEHLPGGSRSTLQSQEAGEQPGNQEEQAVRRPAPVRQEPGCAAAENVKVVRTGQKDKAHQGHPEAAQGQEKPPLNL